MKIRKIVLYIWIFLGCFFLCSCNTQKNNPIDKGFFTVSLRTDFIWEGKKYVRTEYTYDDVFHTFLGYFVNAEDLEKWKEIDNDESLIYIIDSTNGLYNWDITGHLSNRFEVYASDLYGTDVLGIRSIESNLESAVFKIEE